MYKIYVDLDEVLVDYRKVVKKFGYDLDMLQQDQELEDVFWDMIHKRSKKKLPIWGGMSPMPDALELWNYVKKYDCEILSSMGVYGTPTQEKQEWVRRHIGDVPVNLVYGSPAKAKFATPNSILIDDKLKSIEPWIAAGGIGILHTDTLNTIKQLKAMGL